MMILIQDTLNLIFFSFFYISLYYSLRSPKINFLIVFICCLSINFLNLLLQLNEITSVVYWDWNWPKLESILNGKINIWELPVSICRICLHIFGLLDSQCWMFPMFYCFNVFNVAMFWLFHCFIVWEKMF